MRILRPTLIGLTLALSAVSIYLATVVADERERAKDAAQQRREVTIRLEKLVASQPKAVTAGEPAAEAAAGSGTAAAAPAAAARAPAEDDNGGGSTRAAYNDSLRQLTDPVARAALLTQQRETERAEYPRLASELRLTATEADDLFTILGEQSLRHYERDLRNQIAGRNEFVDSSLLDAAAQEELTALLGSDRFGQLQEYRDGYPERRRIDALNERLGKDNAFTAAEAAQLAQVMRQERAAFVSELRRLPGDVRFSSGWPESARLGSEERAARLRFGDSHIGRIEAHYARIRDRASAFLSPEQMQRLRQLQDERLADEQVNLIRSRYLGTVRDALQKAEAARKKK